MIRCCDNIGNPPSDDEDGAFPESVFPRDVFPEEVFPSDIFPRPSGEEDGIEGHNTHSRIGGHNTHSNVESGGMNRGT